MVNSSITPYYRWENWETERLNYLPKTTQLVSSRARAWTHILSPYTVNCWADGGLGCGDSCSFGKKEHACISVHAVYIPGYEEAEKKMKTVSQKCFRDGKGRSRRWGLCGITGPRPSRVWRHSCPLQLTRLLDEPRRGSAGLSAADVGRRVASSYWRGSYFMPGTGLAAWCVLSHSFLMAKLFLLLFYRWKNRGSRKLCDLHKAYNSESRTVWIQEGLSAPRLSALRPLLAKDDASRSSLWVLPSPTPQRRPLSRQGRKAEPPLCSDLSSTPFPCPYRKENKLSVPGPVGWWRVFLNPWPCLDIPSPFMNSQGARSHGTKHKMWNQEACVKSRSPSARGCMITSQP